MSNESLVTYRIRFLRNEATTAIDAIEDALMDRDIYWDLEPEGWG